MDRAEGRRRQMEKNREGRPHIGNKPPANASDRDVLLRLYRQATVEYSSLADVVETDSESPLGNQEALDQCGLGKRYKTISFGVKLSDGYSKYEPAYKGDFLMGGVTQVVTDHEGKHSTVVIMRRSRLDPSMSDYTNIAFFLHELGHVDDFDKGTNWSVGRSLDMEAMELHAHEFACRRLMAGNYVAPLSMYVGIALEQLAAAQVKSISKAAVCFKQSSLYKECLTFLGPNLGSLPQVDETMQKIAVPP